VILHTGSGPLAHATPASHPAVAKKSKKSGVQEEKGAPREIYSAMEPEPGPGSKGVQKQTLKQLDSYEPVPSAQREPITRRLKLIERLIREHGRAYDFRTITIAELTAILQYLESPARGRGAAPRSDDLAETRTQPEDSHGEPQPPEPPKKKIHLPELNHSRPEAPPEEPELEESSDSGTATIHSTH